MQRMNSRKFDLMNVLAAIHAGDRARCGFFSAQMTKRKSSSAAPNICIRAGGEGSTFQFVSKLKRFSDITVNRVRTALGED
jgi:hypothetical protein